MSDFRIFCWGMFLGLGGTSALFNFGVQRAENAAASPGEAIIAMGLAVGSIAVISFGSRAAKK